MPGRACGATLMLKQNTVYEIYQCDWSSDVCSSDLTAAALCGCSSVVERHVANVNVVGSSPITRFLEGSASSDAGPFSVLGNSCQNLDLREGQGPNSSGARSYVGC